MAESEVTGRLHFPKRFLWGAAVSAHQVEGGLSNNWTEWEQHNARSLAAAAPHRLSQLPIWNEVKAQATTPTNYVSGQAIDHRGRYQLDLAIAKKLHLSSFRFSIEWSRIEPEQGVWSREAIDYYRDYIREIRAAGMEPLPTLYHWTVPIWFAKKGGFEKRRNVEYFERFAERMIDEYHREIHLITSINEPDTVASHGYITLDHPPQKRSFVKAFMVYRNLLLAHTRVHSYAHKKSRRLRVGFTKSYAWVTPGDDRWLSRIAAKLDLWLRDDIVLHRVRRKIDFIGVNYYFSDRRIGLKLDQTASNPNDLGWDMKPGDLEHVLVRLSKWKKPLLICETGVADARDHYRRQWLAGTIAATHRAMSAGVDVLGYTAWSMFDNFEWAYGRWPRFGLVAIDYKDGLRRTVRPSGLWYARVIKQMRGL